MKTEIDENGLIIIEAETPMESFALNQIVKKWDKPEKMHDSIIVKTAVEDSSATESTIKSENINSNDNDYIRICAAYETNKWSVSGYGLIKEPFDSPREALESILAERP